MSMHMSIVMVRGDHRADAAALFEGFDYRPLGSRTVATFDAAMEALDYPQPGQPSTTVHKAVVVCGGWTVIFDPELLCGWNIIALFKCGARSSFH